MACFVVCSLNASVTIWHVLFHLMPVWLYGMCCFAWSPCGYTAFVVCFPPDASEAIWLVLFCFPSNTYRAIQFFVCFHVTPWGLGDICCVCFCLMLLSLLACLKKHLIEASANAFLIETSVQSQSSLCVCQEWVLWSKYQCCSAQRPGKPEGDAFLVLKFIMSGWPG